MALTGYLAAEGFTEDLRHELSGASVVETHDRLIVCEGPPRKAAWAQNVWYDVLPVSISSIGDAARQLRAMQRSWALYSSSHHRRAALIADRLPPLRQRPVTFGEALPASPLGSFTLTDRDRMLVSARCKSPFPHGLVSFDEDTEGPPSRAYLKLWELFTLTGRRPAEGERCIDLGSSPGGWTWVLATLGAEVLSVDKAELAPSVAAMPNVRFERGSAFAADPDALGPIDWLFSDVICYPKRLLALVERFIAAGTAANMVCTIKFQGQTDHGVTAAFAAIPGSDVVHLSHNRHELTWFRLAAD